MHLQYSCCFTFDPSDQHALASSSDHYLTTKIKGQEGENVEYKGNGAEVTITDL
jgi:hypothetical protein